MKQVTSLRYIYKITGSELAKNDWNITIKKSRKQTEDEFKKELIKKRKLIGLADSQGFRFIKEIAKIKDEDEFMKFREYIVSIDLQNGIEESGTMKVSIDDNGEIKGYNQCVTCEKCSDKDAFDMALKKLIINGKSFKRFCGTAGGIKKSTILFVSEDIYDELEKRANNGRKLDIKMVNAKFEAYKSLMFSSSIPVSMPNGIAVVHDCITEFKEDTIFINDVGIRGGKIKEPTVEIKKDLDIKLNITDGFGLCKTTLIEKWTKDVLNKNEITKDEIFSGVCIRNAFTKGMIYPFDIDEWIDEYNNGNSIIIDVWGNEVDLRKCELILTEGMLKLWSSYDSLEDFLNNCEENNYTFAVCKTAEKKIDRYRTLNYQYLQSFEMSDKDLMKLVTPTIERINDCNCGDYHKTLKYLGVKENMKKEEMKEFSFKEALALCPELLNDEYIIKKVENMIKKEKDETKIGKIQSKGNYQIASGDPFCLMQSMFGIEVTGLLKKGEFYSSFWVNENVNEVLIMRSPMTVHNNIVKGRISHKEECKKWYKHMENIMILNAWDNTMSAENGED